MRAVLVRFSSSSFNSRSGSAGLSWRSQIETVSKKSRYLWFGGLILLVFLLGLFPVVNGDIWWHLRTGQLILERGEVPDTDWFTYTNPDAKWTDLHWGFQVIAATLWALGGAAALVIAKSMVGSGVFALGLSNCDKQAPAWCIVLAWIPAAIVFAGRYYVRPEMASLLLLMAFITVLHWSWQRPRLLWLLPLLQVLWVNQQGLFILGGVLLGCFWCEWLYRYWTTTPKDKAEFPISLKQLGLVTVATAIGTLVNPYGLRGAMFPLELFAKVRGEDRAFFFQFSGELAGMNEFVSQHPLGVFGLFTNLSSGVLMLLVILAVSTLVMLAIRKQVNVFHWLLIIGFCYLTWQMRRNSVLLAVVAGYVLQHNVQILWLDAVEKGKATKSKWPSVLVAVVLGLLIVSVPTGFFHQVRLSFPPRQFGWGITNLYPHDAAKFLAKPGMPKRIYAMNEGAAAVCIFHLGPDQKVFADARLETNTRKTLQLYQAILAQLSDDYRGLAENLRTGPDEDNPEIPALLIDSYTLVKESQRMPRLLAGIIEGKKNNWQCVYCSFSDTDIPSDDRLPVSANVILGGCVFLDRAKAKELKLPDHGKTLARLLLRIRRSF